MRLGEFFSNVWESFAPWLGSIVVVVATGIVLVLARVILAHAGKDGRSLPYQRQIASTLIVLAGVFGFVVLLPIEADVRGQILSLLGVLISAVIALSSTSIVGNAMAGIMMRLSRSYRPGDFIEVGETLGRVTDQGLLHTQVQLITRDIVALPNLYLSQRPVHVTRSSGTFVSVDVSLGYDIPTSDAEEALRDAVTKAGLEEPYVLVQKLLDHAIRYRVFGLLSDTKELLSARSRLRRGIVTTLHGSGIQIVSPGFVNRVEYPTDHRFVPERTGAEKTADEERAASEESVEAVAFDKAEEAESIEKLRALQEKLRHRREELGSEAKEADDKDRRRELDEKREEVERRIERVGEIIDSREEEREERELDE
ncbi:MAG: mechanosensitive ion channel domain-containing protein [Spirochaetota bacterium]